MKQHIASLDFDGTLRVDNMEKACIEFLENLPNHIISVINTGRGITLVKEKVKTYFPEHYDLFMNAMSYFICNNGTDIYYKEGDEYQSLSEWSEYLKDQWDRPLLLERLTPLAAELEFDLFPEIYNYKLLYYFFRPSFEEAAFAINTFKKSIADQQINIVYAESSQKPPEGQKRFVCEIFPQKAGKGNALLFLKNYLEKHGKEIETIACFGDDRNDFQTVIEMPMKYSWWYGCLVGNSTEWILDKAHKAMADIKGKIIIAPQEYPGPSGIKWIMKQLDWV
jgi:HAD superfamily hydrolase (TIGR01484 family)